MASKELRIAVDDATEVSALLMHQPDSKALYVLAHGAGAGMKHAFMEAIAVELLKRKISTLRYQFPYMERGSRRPDTPPLCHATVRAAVAKGAQLLPDLPIVAGGKSFGGRMTSQAQSSSPSVAVIGLVFLGFPLHAAKKPSDSRAEHLSKVKVPMLFLQGTRDELADMNLMKPLAKRLGKVATLIPIEAADHSFHVLARSGRTDAQVLSELADRIDEWIVSVTNP